MSDAPLPSELDEVAHDSHDATEFTDEPARRRRRRVLRWIITPLLIAIAAVLGADSWLWSQRERYQVETARLRASMTELERARTDELVAQEKNKLGVTIELLRRQARIEPALHLSVALDSSAMYLEREGALLRAMPVEVGPEQRVGIEPDTVRLAVPRGVRTITRIAGEQDVWDVPTWVYLDRGVEVPQQRALAGALGPVAIVLDGGGIIYSMPSVGPMNDSAYVLPGAIRARAADLRAVLPNLHPGMRVYFY